MPQYLFIFERYLTFVARFLFEATSIAGFLEKTPNTWTVLARNAQ